MSEKSASLRFINTFWDKPWDLFAFPDCTPDERQTLLSSIFEPGCPRCKTRFLTSLAERLAAPPQLTQPEQEAIVDEIVAGCSEDPMILSMYGVEVLHADSRQAVQACMTKRKQLPVTTYAA